jgi:hypothetical protein
MEPSMNRSALFVLISIASIGAQAHTYVDNERVLGAFTGTHIVGRDRWEQPCKPAGRGDLVPHRD